MSNENKRKKYKWLVILIFLLGIILSALIIIDGCLPRTLIVTTNMDSQRDSSLVYFECEQQSQKTPAVFPGLIGGSYKLRVFHPGYDPYPYEELVIFKPFQAEQTIHAEFVPMDRGDSVFKLGYLSLHNYPEIEIGFSIANSEYSELLKVETVDISVERKQDCIGEFQVETSILNPLTTIDIVLLIDQSGTMNDTFDVLIDNLLRFVDQLVLYGVNVRIAGYTFGEDTIEYNARTRRIFTKEGLDREQAQNQAELFKTWLSRVEKGKGSNEHCLDAIVHAAQTLSFRSNAVPVFILFTDEKPDLSGAAQATIEDAKNALIGKRFYYYAPDELDIWYQNRLNGRKLGNAVTAEEMINEVPLQLSGYILKFQDPISQYSINGERRIHIVATTKNNQQFKKHISISLEE